MQAQLAMNQNEFKIPTRQKTIRYQSNLFNAALSSTIAELSNSVLSNSEQTIEYSVRQSLLTTYQPLKIDGSMDLQKLVIAESSSNKEMCDSFKGILPNQEYGEDKESLICFDHVPPLTQLKYQKLPVTYTCAKKNQLKYNKECRLRQTFLAHQGPIWATQLSPDSTYLVTGGRDSILRVFHFTKSALLSPPSFKSGENFTQTFDAKQQTTHLPAIITTPPLRQYHGHVNDITSVSINENNYIISGSVDKTVRIWHPLKSFCLGVINFTSQVTSVVWDPFNPQIFFAADFNYIYRIDHSRQKKIRANSAPLIEILVNAHFIYCLSSSGFVFVRDKTSLQLISQFAVCSKSGKNAEPQEILSGFVSNSLNELLILSSDQRLRVYSAWSGTQLQKFKGFNVKNGARVQIFDCDLEKVKSNFTEGQIVRDHETFAVVPTFDQKIQIFCQLFVSNRKLNKEEIKISKFEPMNVNGPVNDQFQSVKVDYKISQTTAISVVRNDVLGERNKVYWGLIAAGEDGQIRVYDYQ
ncbi:WD-containing_protein [Hexamita inflata]|uniref:WD-containing protein n=1 Tax=Hexamita inflata TaxID=28002 RepID=A0AA86PJZ6_9EUKA|nr:WD-containing protein [Hexamita inflata]